MKSPLQFSIQPYNIMQAAHEVFMYCRASDGTYMNARGVEMSPLTAGLRANPALYLEPGELQGLMDELWRAGVRPTEGHASTGQLAAIQAHLADLRTLTFHTLKVKP